jgi:hypothetical protein
MDPQMETSLNKPTETPASERLIELAKSVNELAVIVQDQAMKIFSPEQPEQAAQEPIEMVGSTPGPVEDKTFAKEMDDLLRGINRRMGKTMEILGGFI